MANVWHREKSNQMLAVTSDVRSGSLEVLSSNQPNLTLLICFITDIIWDFIPLLTAANYFNMTVSNKKALATLDTVHKWT